MKELSTHKVEYKKDWTLTPQAFARLLNWLDEGANSEGQRYLEMRRRLVSYFDRKNCSVPEELADECLNRVSRRLEEESITEGEIPAKYCYIVARFVFLESLRRTPHNHVPLGDIERHPVGQVIAAPAIDDEREIKEKRLHCLEQCTDQLAALNRELIIRYYTGQERIKIENRRALAVELGLTMNALSIRACRIRDQLEACVNQCVSEG